MPERLGLVEHELRHVRPVETHAELEAFLLLELYAKAVDLARCHRAAVRALRARSLISINPPPLALGKLQLPCASSSRCPAVTSIDVRASLEAFARHGGLEGLHKDGWGLAYYADEDAPGEGRRGRLHSECLRFIHDHPFVSGVVISHIRKATQGQLAMKNCQPFARELGGRMHVFAHNGDLDMARLRGNMSLRRFHPVGDTDSEYVLRAARSCSGPCAAARAARRSGVCRGAARVGPANFLYTDGDALYIHGDRRISGPGLHVVQRRCAPNQRLVLAASVPLTAEPGWQPLNGGALVVARGGDIVARIVPESVRRRHDATSSAHGSLAAARRGASRRRRRHGGVRARVHPGARPHQPAEAACRAGRAGAAPAQRIVAGISKRFSSEPALATAAGRTERALAQAQALLAGATRRGARCPRRRAPAPEARCSSGIELYVDRLTEFHDRWRRSSSSPSPPPQPSSR